MGGRDRHPLRLFGRLLACTLLLAGARPLEAHAGLEAQLAALDRKIEARPASVELRLERSDLLRRMGRLGPALLELDRVQALRPRELRVRRETGLIYLAQGRLREAETELGAYLGHVRNDARAWAARAHVRRAAGRPELAVEDYHLAIALGPTPDLYLERGRLQVALGRLGPAADGLAEGLERLGGAVVLRKALIAVQRRRGRYDAAAALVGAALHHARVKTAWLLLRAEIHVQRGDPAAANRDREAALLEAGRLVERKGSSLALLSRARAHLALGHLRAAGRDLQKVLSRHPGLPEAERLREEIRGARRGSQNL